MHINTYWYGGYKPPYKGCILCVGLERTVSVQLWEVIQTVILCSEYKGHRIVRTANFCDYIWCSWANTGGVCSEGRVIHEQFCWLLGGVYSGISD